MDTTLAPKTKNLTPAREIYINTFLFRFTQHLTTLYQPNYAA
jgi:hypothetical protein